MGAFLLACAVAMRRRRGVQAFDPTQWVAVGLMLLCVATVLTSAALLPGGDGVGEPQSGRCSRVQCFNPATIEQPKPITQRFRWLHFPKTGTSFALVLYDYVCSGLTPEMLPTPARHENQGFALPQFEEELKRREDVSCDLRLFRRPRVGHRSLPQGDMSRTTSVYVAMFRDPRERLRSAYMNGLHAVGVRAQRRLDMLRTVKTPRDFVNFPGVKHCQVKMMAGYKCGEDVEVTHMHVKLALHRLRTHFVFVGITDSWTESVCLFHRMFGGRLVEHAFHNVRETTGNLGNRQRRRANDTMTPNGGEEDDDDSEDAAEEEPMFTIADDPLDWLLYTEARRIFTRNLVKYGLVCPENADAVLHDRR
ncbi:hypothetical protein PTSG_01186 [Salpingoeca rosetta]|uniref:Sulfotransferase domain-containing protein n=1 Tax=Salpingoeca rosetta (strain ATCC 50818 / BSB-021) TaxID=946362 RepID=F2U123_SALR5|nr:uncharacterized protein PTSG_01186 [Salpingoeca rosetta]EGD80597.1 hypothetical protein PTSG_01186 [Salpingoeca rosetta]|eukprot:XP_004997158.1 hypothetical protein PTSG_01186 [Salpingoeca rosetta]